MSSSRTMMVRLARQMGVSILTGALDVADDAAGGVIHELDANLGDASARAWTSAHEHRSCGQRTRHTSAAEHASDLDELDGDLGRIHVGDPGTSEGTRAIRE